MQFAPWFSLRAAGFIGNERSDAIKDLSHGIIRAEDWESPDHFTRYQKRRYFGELDAIDAYQIISLVAEDQTPPHAWLGDGIVETASLSLLSDMVYRAQGEPPARVHTLYGKSHFQVVQAPETHSLLTEIFSRK